MPDRDKFIWRKHLLAWGYKSRLRLSPWQSPRLWKGPVTYEVIAQVRKKGWRGTALKQSVCGKTSQGFTVGTVLYHSFRFLKEVGNSECITVYVISLSKKNLDTFCLFTYQANINQESGLCWEWWVRKPWLYRSQVTKSDLSSLVSTSLKVNGNNPESRNDRASQ